jgi:small subunit ribosomal protein S4e
LKLSLSGRESKMVICAKEGNIAIDGKIRKDAKFPVGFMDVLTILKTKTNYRLLYDSKGKFGLNKISPSEAEFKLCKVKCRAMGPKGIPYIVTHDGRTIRFPNPEIKANDTVRVNLRNGEITDFYKFEEGCQVMIKGGNNIGRHASMTGMERHLGSYDIIYCMDAQKKVFSTRIDNVFVIGKTKPEITLMRSHQRLSIIEERDVKNKRKHVEQADNEDEE